MKIGASRKSSRVGNSKARLDPRNSSALRDNRTAAGTRTATAGPAARAARTTCSTTAAAANPTDSATAAAHRNNPVGSSKDNSRNYNSNRNCSRDNVFSRPGNNSNRNGRSSRQPRGNRSGDGCSMVHGASIVHGSRAALNGGTANIALGRSVEAMAATTFLRPASVSISGVNTGSGCAAAPRCTWGIRASRTAAFRSWILPLRPQVSGGRPCDHGRNVVDERTGHNVVEMFPRAGPGSLPVPRAGGRPHVSSKRRASAGARSPALSRTISPGTSFAIGNSNSCPSRRTSAVVATCFRMSSTECRAWNST